MEVPLTIEGLEGREVVASVARVLSGPKVLIEGRTAQRGRRRNTFILERNDGAEVSIELKSPLFGAVHAVVDGKSFELLPSLRWYQYVWLALPLALVLPGVGGGAVGGGLGAAAFIINLRLFRSGQRALSRYAMTGLVTVGAVIVYIAVATLIGSLVTA